MTKTVSIKLSEDDFQALVKYCGHEDLDKSKLVREALRKCVPKFKGIANPEGFPKGRKRDTVTRSVARASSLAQEIDAASKKSAEYFH